MAKWPWIERTFTFDFPAKKHPDIVERFAGLPARIDERVRGLTRAQLTWTDTPGPDAKGWSIQENIGHLIQLEAIFGGRIEDFLAGLPELRPADITNQATHRAKYNEHDINAMTAELRTTREAQVRRLRALSDTDFARVSVHPRLKVPMRLVDAVCFVCEHDDYHMARISELRRAQGLA